MDSQIIWFCGFYEGEGSISNDISNNNRLRISISQNDPTPLVEGKNRWGGSVRKRTRISLTGKECNGNEWTMSHNDSLKFVEDIKPYMKIPRKIEQIDNAISLWKNFVKGSIKFKCSFCDKEYSNPSGRRRHVLNDHKNIDIKFSCSKCDKIYNTLDSAKRHIKQKHPDASVVKLRETSKLRELP